MVEFNNIYIFYFRNGGSYHNNFVFYKEWFTIEFKFNPSIYSYTITQ